MSICGSNHDEVTEYQLLVRCLSEQTVVEEAVQRLRTKEDGGLHSGMLQNPSNSDATYRTKAGKGYQGNVANLEKTVGSGESVVMDYQYEQDNYSDSQFLKDSLERTPQQEATVTRVADSAYSGKENQDLASEKNIHLVNTDLSGKAVDDILANLGSNGSEDKGAQMPGRTWTEILRIYRREVPAAPCVFHSGAVCGMSEQRSMQGEAPQARQYSDRIHKDP